MIASDWSALGDALADTAFGQGSCLTFYLVGLPEQHRELRPILEALDATNLDGEESGWVYAKVPVRLTKSDIQAKISQVSDSASAASVQVDLIDLDSTADVGRARFYILWTPS